MELGIASVAAIKAIAYLVGMAVKTTGARLAQHCRCRHRVRLGRDGVHQSVKQLTKQEQMRQYAGGVCASACCCMCGRVL